MKINILIFQIHTEFTDEQLKYVTDAVLERCQGFMAKCHIKKRPSDGIKITEVFGNQ